MKGWQKILLTGSAVLVGGAALSLLFLPRVERIDLALTLGYIYVGALFLAVLLVYRLIVPKLEIFSPVQQWLLKTLLYAMALTGAFLFGLIVQTVLLLPPSTLTEIAIRQVWKTLVYLVSLPFRREGGSAPGMFGGPVPAIAASFLFVILLISLVSLVGSYVEIRWKETRRQQAQQRAELMALRAQIEPHFLFNSLNTIAGLIRQDPPQAERLLIRLSNMLRYLFHNADQALVELRREVEFTRGYAELMQARFGEMLQVEWEERWSQEDYRVPALILQPLLENAIRHGWEDRSRPLHLSIRIVEEDGQLFLTVQDDGRGIPPDRKKSLWRQGHALDNIAERLWLLYRRRDLVHIDSREGEGTTVTITLPAGRPIAHETSAQHTGGGYRP
ncbi:MAG: hypothetical protein D6681_07525 [Calditrichaeota bacterium]|nr:MAG: hypothetical protein D6681_07525 [Calditrichota bacterium]